MRWIVLAVALVFALFAASYLVARVIQAKVDSLVEERVQEQIMVLQEENEALSRSLMDAEETVRGARSQLEKAQAKPFIPPKDVKEVIKRFQELGY